MKLFSLRILSENSKDDYSLMIQSLGIAFSIAGDASEISDLMSLLLELAEQGINPHYVYEHLGVLRWSSSDALTCGASDCRINFRGSMLLTEDLEFSLQFFAIHGTS
jgi:hypothetical protein